MNKVTESVTETHAWSREMIRTISLHKTYPAEGMEIAVLKGIDLSICRGEFVGIMGASGSGKSTLLHLLGLLDVPTSGEIYLCGRRADQLTEREMAKLRCRDIGFVFQSFHLVPGLTILENIMVPNLLLGRQADMIYLKGLLDQFGLSHRLRHRPAQLSGGEQQRVAIARALANRPSILLADEPTGSLDSRTSEQILDLLQSLHIHHGITMVLVTHSVELVARCDRVINMKDGVLA